MTNAPFLAACLAGDLTLVQRLSADFSAAAVCHALRVACKEGHLEVAQWLADHFGLTAADACWWDNKALRAACKNGHLETAQWLASHFGLTAADARTDDNYALRAACRNGHLATAQWLVSHFDLTAADVRWCNHSALRMACLNKHRETVRWVVVAAEYSAGELAALSCHWRKLLPDLEKELQTLGPKSACFGV